MLHTHFLSAYGFSADNLRHLQRLNDPYQCHGFVACNCSYNADLTPPLHKRSQAVAWRVGAGW